jgi:predicted transcriptional regulator
MTLTIDLSPELERRLADEAAQRGQQPEEFARTVLEERLATLSQMERNQRAIALLDQWTREDAASEEDAGPPPIIPPLSLREISID